MTTREATITTADCLKSFHEVENDPLTQKYNKTTRLIETKSTAPKTSLYGETSLFLNLMGRASLPMMKGLNFKTSPESWCDFIFSSPTPFLLNMMDDRFKRSEILY